MDKKLAIEDLELVKQVLDQHKMPFFLAYGTCLGAYRDGDFLPGDDDIDLGIIEPIDLKTKKSIGWMLYDLGFKNQQIAFNVFDRMELAEIGYNGTEKTGIICCEKNIKFTIFFYEVGKCDKHGDVAICTAKLGALPLIESPLKYYKNFDKVKFYGKEYNVPGPIEGYLEFTYKDWKNPLMRDHGETFFEQHPKKQGMLKNDGSAQRVIRKISK